MSGTSMLYPTTSVSTFGFLGAAELQDPAGGVTTGLRAYGVRVLSPDLANQRQATITRPLHKGMYFIKVAQSSVIECYHFRADESCAAAEDPPETHPRGINSSLRDVTAPLYFLAANARAAGEDTRPLIRPEYEVVGKQVQIARTFIAQEETNISKVIKACSGTNKPRPAQSPRSLGELVSELRKLQKGWNGYTAPAPAAVAVENAKTLLAEAELIGIIAERVEPSAMGGVGVTFTARFREVVVEFYNTGTAHALFADNETEDLRTEPVPTDRDGHRSFFEKVRQYLYGQHAVSQARGPTIS